MGTDPFSAPDARPFVTRGAAAAPLEDLVQGTFGTPILDVAFSPSGKRVFATTESYGEWLFALSPSGEILEHRLPPVRDGFSKAWNLVRGELRPVDDKTLGLCLWDGNYLYDFDRGWIGRSVDKPPHNLPMRNRKPGEVYPLDRLTRLEDAATHTSFLGGAERVRALDAKGRLLWRLEDSLIAPDLYYPRATFPRALSRDGRVLLVSAFGVHSMMYGDQLINPALLGIDATSGKLLWHRDGIRFSTGRAVRSFDDSQSRGAPTLLTAAKLVAAFEDRFLVRDDDGKTHAINAADGTDIPGVRALAPGTEWGVALPERGELLVVENNRFERHDRTARVYIRSFDGKEERDLPVAGRVVAVESAPDNQSFFVVTRRDRTLRFAAAGKLLWDAETPAGSLVRFSPDGKTIAVGTHDGVVYFLSAADGKRRGKADLNPFNTISPEDFAGQKRMGEIPREATREAPPEPPEPSYLAKFDAGVAFGPNLAPPERMRALLKPAQPAASDGRTDWQSVPRARPGYVGTLTGPVQLTLKVEAGTTYLVEMLNAVANPADEDPALRLEVAVTAAGRETSKNLPYTARLPLGSLLTRRRAAFRADAAGEVTLSLRAVAPTTSIVKVRNRDTEITTYEKAAASEVPVLLGDVVVSAVRFAGRNLLYDGGPEVPSKPAGTPICTAQAHKDGSNRDKPDPVRPGAAGRVVNGVIANQETAWAEAAKVDWAEVVVKFTKPRKLSAIAIYEDASGPVVTEGKVRERAATRYQVDVYNASTRQWVQLARVVDNTQLLNIFACPDFEVAQMRYTWAGRHDSVVMGRTDGFVRTAQIEAYAASDVLEVDRGREEGDRK
jgi:outer membrane protein assembly factor BamB